MQAAILTEPNTPFRIETVTVDEPKAGEVLVKLTDGRGVDRAFEAVGIPTLQERAFAPAAR